MRRMSLAAAALAVGLVSAVFGRAAAQVQVVIPFPAGGGSDIIGRMMQPVLAEELGTSVLIRNLGGAAGTLGAAEVARAKPDGTTLLLTSMAPIAIQPSFRPSIPYQPVDKIRCRGQRHKILGRKAPDWLNMLCCP